MGEQLLSDKEAVVFKSTSEMTQMRTMVDAVKQQLLDAPLVPSKAAADAVKYLMRKQQLMQSMIADHQVIQGLRQAFDQHVSVADFQSILCTAQHTIDEMQRSRKPYFAQLLSADL